MPEKNKIIALKKINYMKTKLVQIKAEALRELAQVKAEAELRNLEIKYLGRKSELTMILRELNKLSEQEKKDIGKFANDIKMEIAAKVEAIRSTLSPSAKEAMIDVTLPGAKIEKGHLHPITQVQNELEDLFTSMGFMVLDGPELESDYFNFEALNIPRHHPARDMQDTFYIDDASLSAGKKGQLDLLMRTQTSPMQVRAMRKYGAPIKCIVPGRCFRSEATDVRHEHTFYQLEGLMIDKNINFSNLKSVLLAVGKKLFGEETQLRMRPKFYPFVEPGANGEYTCFLCKGKGCRLCKKTGWLEIVGSGMVHPKVLEAGGIDPKKFQGFAFGFGLDRLVMLKYQIEDIRQFHSGDIRFLNQF